MSTTRMGLICFVLAIGLSACSLVEPDNYEQTYPQALDVEQVSLRAARHALEAPDTANVVVYVIDINICPQNLMCYIPDGILIAENLDPERPAETLHLSVTEPRQFRKQGHYTMSVGIYDRQLEGVGGNAISLLGYSQKSLGPYNKRLQVTGR